MRLDIKELSLFIKNKVNYYHTLNQIRKKYTTKFLIRENPTIHSPPDTYHRIWLVNVEGVEVEPDLADVIRDLADGHGAGRGDGASALQNARIFASV